MSKVSVIMATYNGQRVINESIKSILAQTHEDLELIVVDDGSIDNTVALVRAYSDDRLSLLKQKNSGSPSAPRNLGIRAAKGEFIAFCDQDDVWYPEKLAKQLTAYEDAKHLSEIGIIFSSADLIDENGKKVDESMVKFEGYLLSAEAHKQMLFGDYIIACSAMVPKRVLDEAGALDESLVGVDDYDLWLRITGKYGVLAVSEKLCAWRQTKGSLSQDKAKQYARTEQIFAKLGDKSEDIKAGHGKNMLRIILSSLLVRDYETTNEYLDKINNYPLSPKAKLIVRISGISLLAGRLFVMFLQQIGKVSL